VMGALHERFRPPPQRRVTLSYVALPQAFAGRPNETGRAAELVGQLRQKIVEPILRYLRAMARLFREE
jgi:hypothetical protein